MGDRIPDSSLRLNKNLARLSWSLWGIIILLTSAGLILLAVNRPQIGRLDFPGYYLGVLIALVYSSIGILIIRYRPRLPFGWLFLILAVPAAIANFTMMYAVYGLLLDPGADLPGTEFAAWLQNWILYLVFPAPFAILFTLFPNGRLPSPKWRWLIIVSLVVTFLQITVAMTTVGPFVIYITASEIVLPLSNPTGLSIPVRVYESLGFGWILGLLTIPVGASAILVRYRSSGWVERQQLKWLAWLLVVLILLITFSFLGNELIGEIAFVLLIMVLPTGTALAILRYNLYGIDLIIRRTVQYTLVTGILAAVYFSLVIALQAMFSDFTTRQSPLILVISTLTIAALFNPLRLRILTSIDRRFFRGKYDADRILSEFADAMRAEVDLENFSAALLSIVHKTVQPARSSLWLKDKNR